MSWSSLHPASEAHSCFPSLSLSLPLCTRRFLLTRVSTGTLVIPLPTISAISSALAISSSYFVCAINHLAGDRTAVWNRGSQLHDDNFFCLFFLRYTTCGCLVKRLCKWRSLYLSATWPDWITPLLKAAYVQTPGNYMVPLSQHFTCGWHQRVEKHNNNQNKGVAKSCFINVDNLLLCCTTFNTQILSVCLSPAWGLPACSSGQWRRV